jgi:spore maturation protein CgeB
LKVFYDIDTPVTLEKLARGDCEYLSRDLIPAFDLYLSFTGGPVLEILERELGARRARPLYCSVDAEQYRPMAVEPIWDLGYMGTYSPDRQPALEELLLAPARRCPKRCFVIVGPQYPPELDWPPNVLHIPHLAPPGHRSFYNAQRFALNVTREEMRRAGFSPSVRLFEAAACGTPIISDCWPGLDRFFRIGEEILVASAAEDSLRYVREMSEPERRRLGRRGRERVLEEHSAAQRAFEFEECLVEVGPGDRRRMA